jgi:hypothetical protein
MIHWGQRFMGEEQVCEALAGRFKGIPGTHMDFAFTSLNRVVDAMRKFLSGQNP